MMCSARVVVLAMAAIASAAVWALGCAATAPTVNGGRPALASMDTSFSFAGGVPVTGRRLTACGRVTLSTTNTERAGASAFRILGAPAGAEVRISFDRAISAFDLTVAGLRPGDTLGDFNAGNPPRLSGTLIQTADGQVTAGGGTGSGTLSWPELDLRELRLVARASGAAPTMTVQNFRVACRTAPQPNRAP